MIECRGLSVGYGSSTILHDLRLHVRRGEILSIVGPNGSGKSTLLRTFARLLPPLEGDILLGGRSISGFAPRELARLVALLPQSRPVPDIRVETLVEHGRFPHLGFPSRLRREDHRAVEQAMALTGTTAWRNLPVERLSGGERQRVYVAMTVAQGAELILLDEPATYLDPHHRYALLELLRTLNRQGRTIVMVLHDLADALAYSDRICVIDGGGIVACDTPERVYASHILDEVFHISSRRLDDPELGTGYCFFDRR